MKQKIFKIGQRVCDKNNQFHSGKVIKITKEKIIVDVYASLNCLKHIGKREYKPNELTLLENE